jgi:hypothetical protein
VAKNVPQFHEALYKLRRDSVLEVHMALAAGVTIALYRSIELGQVPCTPEVYDAAVKMFPVLSKYPRPKGGLNAVTPVLHPVVIMEHDRLAPIMEVHRRLQIGVRNKKAVADMLRMAISGQLRSSDVDFLFGL